MLTVCVSCRAHFCYIGKQQLSVGAPNQGHVSRQLREGSLVRTLLLLAGVTGSSQETPVLG